MSDRDETAVEGWLIHCHYVRVHKGRHLKLMAHLRLSLLNLRVVETYERFPFLI